MEETKTGPATDQKLFTINMPHHHRFIGCLSAWIKAKTYSLANGSAGSCRAI